VEEYHIGSNSRPGGIQNIENDAEDLPIWKQEYKQDEQDCNDKMALFLLERGYPWSMVDEFMKNAWPRTNNCSSLNPGECFGWQ
jgi:SOS response regulatory protein OraA/RecX